MCHRETGKAIWTIYQPGFIFVMATKDLAGGWRVPTGRYPSNVSLPPFFPCFVLLFFMPHFLRSLLLPLPDRLVAYLVWQQQVNSISLWQRSSWCLTHSGQWDGDINHKVKKKRKKACPASCHLNTYSCGFPNMERKPMGARKRSNPFRQLWENVA